MSTYDAENQHGDAQPGPPHNVQGTPGEDEDADTASGGAPEPPDTTDENDRPVDNPSG